MDKNYIHSYECTPIGVNELLGWIYTFQCGELLIGNKSLWPRFKEICSFFAEAQGNDFALRPRRFTKQ